jgi:hypothetical protein
MKNNGTISRDSIYRVAGDIACVLLTRNVSVIDVTDKEAIESLAFRVGMEAMLMAVSLRDDLDGYEDREEDGNTHPPRVNRFLAAARIEELLRPSTESSEPIQKPNATK